MQVEPLAPGLWRWSVGDRGSVYYEPGREPADAIVLVDPIVPDEGSEDAGRFWRALDRDRRRAGLPLAILIGSPRHARSASRIQARYRDGVLLFPTDRIRRGERLPAGVAAFEIVALGEGEVAFWIDEHRALVFADAITRSGGGTLGRVPAVRSDDLRTLIELDPEKLLTSHGDPLLSGGRAALEQLLEAAGSERS